MSLSQLGNSPAIGDLRDGWDASFGPFALRTTNEPLVGSGTAAYRESLAPAPMGAYRVKDRSPGVDRKIYAVRLVSRELRS